MNQLTSLSMTSPISYRYRKYGITLALIAIVFVQMLSSFAATEVTTAASAPLSEVPTAVATPTTDIPSTANQPVSTATTLAEQLQPSTQALSNANQQLLTRNAQLQRQVNDLQTQANVLVYESRGQLFLYGAFTVLISLLVGIFISWLVFVRRERW